MNKIRIMTNEKALTIKMPDAEANVWFGTLCCALLDDWPENAVGDDEPAEDASDDDGLDGDAAIEGEPELVENAVGDDELMPTAVQQPTKSYKGFMHITCERCGNVHAYCTREPSSEYRCPACGNHMPLHDLRRLFLNCECGAKYVYWTNATEKLLELTCLNCKMPVALERDKQGRYTSLRT